MMNYSALPTTIQIVSQKDKHESWFIFDTGMTAAVVVI